MKISAIFFTFWVALSAAAAQQSPAQDGNTTRSSFCGACHIQHAARAYDNDFTTYATFDASTLGVGLLGYISHDYSFAQDLKQGEELVLDLSFSDKHLFGILGLNDLAGAVVFEQLKLELFDGSTSLVTYGMGTDALPLHVELLDANSSRFRIRIIITYNVNKIRITSGALVALGDAPSRLLVHEISSQPVRRYYANRFINSTRQLGLTVCASCQFNDAVNAIPFLADPNSEYAYFNWGLGISLLGTPTMRAEYDWGNTPNLDALGDQDGEADQLVLVLQSYDVANLDVNLLPENTLGLRMHFTDNSTQDFDHTNPLLKVEALGGHTGKYCLIQPIPAGKTLQSFELSTQASTLNLGTQLRIYNIYTEAQGATLPVALTHFEAQAQGEMNLIRWQTAQEKNSAYFEVQRSENALTFETVQTVLSAGYTTAARSYSYLDADAPMRPSIYYRLKQVDRDGRFEYSDIQAVNRASTELLRFTVYPQPAQKTLFVEVDTPVTIYHVAFFTSLAQTVPTEYTRLDQQLRIDLPPLPTGTYVLQLHTAVGLSQHKVFVAR